MNTDTNLSGKLKFAQSPMMIFSWAWSLSMIIHIYYIIPGFRLELNIFESFLFGVFQVARFELPLLLSVSSLFFSSLLLFNPASLLLFCISTFCFLIKLWVDMPMLSNHMLIEFIFCVGAIYIFLQLIIKNKSIHLEPQSYYEIIAPFGRALLIVMYIYGVFHKINLDFLNPEVSCAVTLWQESPIPETLKKANWAHWSVIYGTFIVEGLCIILLLGSSLMRYFGVVLGILFHAFIAFSQFSFYPAFSMLAFSLHFLFLPQNTIHRLLENSVFQKIKQFCLKHKLMLILVWVLVLLAHAAFMVNRNINYFYASFLILSILILAFVIKFGYQVKDTRKGVFSSSIVLNLLAVGFFVNGLLPYLGLKTGQTIAMFSNLSLEGNRSNHLILKKPVYLTEQMQYPITIVSSSNPFLKTLAKHNIKMAEHHFYNLIRSIPNDSVTFTKQDRKVQYDKIKDHLSEFPESSYLAYKLMTFEFIDLDVPKMCSVGDQVYTLTWRSPIKEKNDGY